MWFIAGVGAVLAGLILSFRGLAAWIQAASSGAIRTRRAIPEIVRRDDDPVRFHKLRGDRLREALPGLLAIAGGTAWLVLNIAGLILES